MTRACLAPRIGVGLLAGLGSLAADNAGAAQYVCHVPLSVLCQDCATDVTIALQPRGGCRVSFSPAAGTPSPAVSGAVTLQIQTPAPPVRHGVYARARRAAAPPPSSRGSCFEFNGHQYCE